MVSIFRQRYSNRKLWNETNQMIYLLYSSKTWNTTQKTSKRILTVAYLIDSWSLFLWYIGTALGNISLTKSLLGRHVYLVGVTYIRSLFNVRLSINLLTTNFFSAFRLFPEKQLWNFWGCSRGNHFSIRWRRVYTSSTLILYFSIRVNFILLS